MNKEVVAQFYDSISAQQVKTGANERLVSLYKRLLKKGLQKNSTILELGCGVGNFTRLLVKKIKYGKIEAVDLSAKSIEIAKSQLLEITNVSFDVADVVHYQPKNTAFDFITLMDVIEHIPLEQHPALFQNLSKIASEKTVIAVNIPNPDYIGFARKNSPEILQVIDQEIHLSGLIEIFENNNLELIFFEKYGIWEDEDYHFLLIRKKKPFKLEHLSAKRNLPQKIIKKVTHKIDRVKYR